MVKVIKNVRNEQAKTELEISPIYVDINAENTSNIFAVTLVTKDKGSLTHYLYAPNTKIVDRYMLDNVYQIGTNGEGFGKGYNFNLYSNSLQEALQLLTVSYLLYTDDDLFSCDTITMNIVGSVYQKSLDIINDDNKLVIRKRNNIIEGITEKKMDNETFERLGELKSVYHTLTLDGVTYSVKYNDLDYISMFYSYLGYPTEHKLQIEIETE